MQKPLSLRVSHAIKKKGKRMSIKGPKNEAQQAIAKENKRLRDEYFANAEPGTFAGELKADFIAFEREKETRKTSGGDRQRKDMGEVRGKVGKEQGSGEGDEEEKQAVGFVIDTEGDPSIAAKLSNINNMSSKHSLEKKAKKKRDKVEAAEVEAQLLDETQDSVEKAERRMRKETKRKAKAAAQTEDENEATTRPDSAEDQEVAKASDVVESKSESKDLLSDLEAALDSEFKELTSEQRRDKKRKWSTVSEEGDEITNGTDKDQRNRHPQDMETQSKEKRKRAKTGGSTKSDGHSTAASVTQEQSTQLKDIEGGIGTFRRDHRFIVFIGNLPFSATKESVQAHFKSIMPFSIRLPMKEDAPTKCKGWGFLEFEQFDKLKTALKLYHHSMFNDGISPERKINVELTVGGGGNSEKRKYKIKEKNKKLSDERTRNRMSEEEKQKLKEELSDERAMHYKEKREKREVKHLVRDRRRAERKKARGEKKQRRAVAFQAQEKAKRKGLPVPQFDSSGRPYAGRDSASGASNDRTVTTVSNTKANANSNSENSGAALGNLGGMHPSRLARMKA
jgi:nucleolar protein 6